MHRHRIARQPRHALQPPRGAGHRSVWAAALWVLGLASGCERRARPWDGPLDASVRDESQPWVRPGPDASWLTNPAAVTDGGADGGRVERVSPVGGLWVSCYGGFRPSGEPLRDVTRLGLLCGPPNGLRLVSREPLQGKVAAGARAASHRFEARRGECYRIFAVASSSIEDLDVVVRSSRGSQLAKDHSEDAWPILDPEGPICTFGDDTFTVAVSARRGSGSYAMQIWALPARP